MRRVLKAHIDDILSLAGSRLMSLFVTGAEDGKVRVWDLQHSEMIAQFDRHVAPVRCVKILDPIPALVTADVYGKVCIW